MKLAGPLPKLNIAAPFQPALSMKSYFLFMEKPLEVKYDWTRAGEAPWCPKFASRSGVVFEHTCVVQVWHRGVKQ